MLAKEFHHIAVPPPHPRSSEQKSPQKIRSEQECSLDTPFGTQIMRCLNPVPNELGPKKIWSERKCSLDKAFVGHGGGRGIHKKPFQHWQKEHGVHKTCATCVYTRHNTINNTLPPPQICPNDTQSTGKADQTGVHLQTRPGLACGVRAVCTHVHTTHAKAGGHHRHPSPDEIPVHSARLRQRVCPNKCDWLQCALPFSGKNRLSVEALSRYHKIRGAKSAVQQGGQRRTGPGLHKGGGGSNP